MVNPGINRSMTMPTNVRDFLLQNDKKLLSYYETCEKFMKETFEFLYQACYRFCLRDTQVMYVLSNVKNIYEEKEIREKARQEKMQRELEKENKRKEREEKKKAKEEKKGKGKEEE